MKSTRFLAYLALLLPSVLISAVAWQFLAVDRLYHCSDRVPLLDFVPPFVHSVPDDHYIASPLVVYVVWLLLVAIASLLPAVLLSVISRRDGV